MKGLKREGRVLIPVRSESRPGHHSHTSQSTAAQAPSRHTRTMYAVCTVLLTRWGATANPWTHGFLIRRSTIVRPTASRATASSRSSVLGFRTSVLQPDKSGAGRTDSHGACRSRKGGFRL